MIETEISESIDRYDEIQVLIDLTKSEWNLLWVDNKLTKAAHRLIDRGLVRRRWDQENGPAGRYELWPLVRDRIVHAGAIAIHMESLEPRFTPEDPRKNEDSL